MNTYDGNMLFIGSMAAKGKYSESLQKCCIRDKMSQSWYRQDHWFCVVRNSLGILLVGVGLLDYCCGAFVSST